MKQCIITTFNSIFILMITGLPLQAQFAWIDPPVPDVNDTVTIFIDVSQDPDCQNLVDNPGPMYLWTWEPVEPVNGNGQWNNSIEDNLMFQVSDNVWGFKMIPTEFYGVEADEVYEKGIKCLAKAADGGSGGDCSAGGGEFKTSDISIKVPSPFVSVPKIFSFPEATENDTIYTRYDDVFTLFFNKLQSEKDEVLAANDFYVYARIVGDDNRSYIVTPVTQLETNPNLQMTGDEDEQYRWTIIPEVLFDGILPDGVEPAALRLQVVAAPFCGNLNCVVDGEFFFYFSCLD